MFLIFWSISLDAEITFLCFDFMRCFEKLEGL